MEIVNAPETTSNGSSDPAYPEIRMDDQRVAGFEERHLTLPDARFTPDLELELLFDPQTIPSGMREAAGESYHVSFAVQLSDNQLTYTGPTPLLQRSDAVPFRPPGNFDHLSTNRTIRLQSSLQSSKIMF